VTAAASAHVRTALGNKAFDEASTRGLAKTAVLGNAQERLSLSETQSD
jgi:hypothetical protein